MTRAISLILMGVIIRSIYLHDELYIKIFHENFWVIFYVIGIIIMMAAIVLWLAPSRKIKGDQIVE